MASERIVRIILTGDSAGAVRALSLAGAAAEKTESKFKRMQSVGRGMSSLGSQMTRLSLPMVALGAYSLKSAASFQRSMELIHTQAGKSQAEVDSMSKSVLSIAPQFGTSTAAMADGLYHVESAGYKGSQALKILKAAAMGAKIGGADLTDVTNALDAAVVSGIKGVGDYKSAMGALNATVGAGDMKMQDLADALSTGLLAPMKRYGVSLRDVGAALAVFGDNNIRGAEAGTKLSSAIRIMAAPSKAASDALGQVGLSQLQLAKDMSSKGGLVSAFKDLKKHLTDSGETAQQQALTITRAFGGRQSTGVQVLLNQLPRLESKVKDVARGAAGFGESWKATQKTVSFQWDKLKATAQVALVHLGNALMPLVLKYLPPLVNLIKDAVKWFTGLPKPVKEIVLGLTAFLAIGGPILMFVGSLITAIGTIGTALSFLAANPVVLTIAALVAVGVALVMLYKHSKTFRDGLRLVGQAIVGTFNDIKSLVVGAVHWVGNAFHNVKAWVSEAVKWIGHAFSKVFDILTWPFRKAFKIIKGIVGGIASIPGKIIHGAGSVLHTLSFGALYSGGPVQAKYMAGGGPVGTDTVPGWLTPGEYVLDKATTARIGIPALRGLQSGGDMGGNITITPAPITLRLDSRTIAEGVMRYTVGRAARGPSSLVGGSFLTGSATA